MNVCVQACMFAFMHVCMSAYLHVCMCTCVHVCMRADVTCARVYFCMCACVHVCMCVYVPVCMCACVEVWMCACMRMHVCGCAYVYMCPYVHVYIYACVYECLFACVYMCMCVCVHVCKCNECTCACVHVCLCGCVHICLCVCAYAHVCLRKCKLLLFGGYHYNKANIDTFLGNLGRILDRNLARFDHLLLLCDFNSEPHELSMSNVCETYNLTNLINEPTCYKNIFNSSTIDLILTNKKRRFQNSTTVENGIPDHHKMTMTMMKQYLPKQTPVRVNYRIMKNINPTKFREELQKKLEILGDDITYTQFEKTFIEQLDKHAPLKEKSIRANNQPFMNKTINKAIMNRSRFKNRFLKSPTNINEYNYNKTVGNA